MIECPYATVSASQSGRYCFTTLTPAGVATAALRLRRLSRRFRGDRNRSRSKRHSTSRTVATSMMEDEKRDVTYALTRDGRGTRKTGEEGIIVWFRSRRCPSPAHPRCNVP